MRNYQFTLSEYGNGNDRSMGRPGREEQLGSAEGRARAAWRRGSGSGGRALWTVSLRPFDPEQRLGVLAVSGRAGARSRRPSGRSRTSGQGADRRTTRWGRLDGGQLHALPQCMSGNHHLCPQATFTIVGHKGAFASRVRAHWGWAVPLPERINVAEAGPLLCGGMTVFNPLAMYAKPTSRVGIVDIGGLGHMAVKFAAAYGCEVTAFTSSESKLDEARKFGAHRVVSSRNPDAIKELAGVFDLLLVTVNVPLDWDALIASLGPNGRLHVVGFVLERIPLAVIQIGRAHV